MLKILQNQHGLAVNIAVAMVLVAVTISAMISLINLNLDDSNSVIWQQDKLQQQLLTRTESERVLFMQGRDFFSNRRVEIIGKDRVATHTLNYRNPPTSLVTTPNFYSELATSHLISAMCITRHNRRNAITSLTPMSPVRTYFEKMTTRSSLAQFQYFTDNDGSDLTNIPGHVASRVSFDGRDELHGRVHSNTDILVQNNGQGTNDGWPKFHSLVTTAGEIKRWNGTTISALSKSEKDNIFPHGWREHVPRIEYIADARTIRKNGRLMGSRNADIIYAE
ncbi:MAG: hypothetical protein FWG20_03715, partial [Candidatus Cloacimonetes bacterium]|nr:hypothetical protein [Candidatus Cloacimonadota bacterium]